MPLSIDCPECGEPLEVDDEHRAWKVRCPHCRHEFRPVDDADPDPRPPRRRRRRPEYDPEAAREAVATPAMLLGLVGWGGGLLLLVGAALFVGFGVFAANQPQAPPQPGNEPPEFFIFMGACFGVFGVPYFGAIIYGARHLGRLTSYGWAMASAVLATASIVLFGVCGILLIGPGIWALVVLNRPEVREGFKANRYRDPVPDDDDDD